MRRAPARIALGGIFGHGLSPSMVLFGSDAKSIAGVELESDTPRPVDMDRVADRNKTFQGVELKPRKIHLLRRGRSIEAVKTDQNALVHLGIYLGRSPFRPQFGQRLASEGPDHDAL